MIYDSRCALPADITDPLQPCPVMRADPLWWLTKDSDLDCAELYERHYSAYRYADGRARDNGQFVGPGEKVVLRTEHATALFVWRKFIDDSGQQGINCAVFRNESNYQSSQLIRQADAIADCLWPDRRHYTYVDPAKITSTNPGFCFIAAGWRRCGRTKGGLVILERVTDPTTCVCGPQARETCAKSQGTAPPNCCLRRAEPQEAPRD
jgi:hypothetical protein